LPENVEEIPIDAPSVTQYAFQSLGH